MSEEAAPLEQSSSGSDSNGLALDLAMEAARSDPSLHAEVTAFLGDQRRMLADQRHHLHEQLKQLHLGMFEKWLGVALRLATLVVGIAVAGGATRMVWDAAHSAGLIVESFAVPPDMTARGLSGDVVASKMLDRLTAMQEATNSSRGPQSYENNWGSNLKVEIPDTGVSIGEVQRFLKEWLGHDTRIRGEVYRTASGLAVTARAGAESGVTFEGKDGELDALLQKAAEHVYAQTQPYRYANFLDRNRDAAGLADRLARARAIYWDLTRAPDREERAWAWNGLGTLATITEPPGRGSMVSAAYYRKALQVWPDFTIGHFALGYRETYMDHEENQLAAFRAASRLLHRDTVPDVNPKIVVSNRGNADFNVAYLTGDWAEAARQARIAADQHVEMANTTYLMAQTYVLLALAYQHDAGAIAAYRRDLGITGMPDYFNVLRPMFYAARQDWRNLRDMTQLLEPARRQRFYANQPLARALIARALAELGDLKGAEALVAPAPGDCDGCGLARARIADLQGQHGRADFWFARVEEATPSIPFADQDWGTALLARGKPDAAIEKFARANKLGPKFADPLEGWGEALMAKNQSHQALAKFGEAEKYAPNWGRLHLKWGEALAYSGKKEEAAKHFTRAATLDLTPAEKSELERHI